MRAMTWYSLLTLTLFGCSGDKDGDNTGAGDDDDTVGDDDDTVGDDDDDTAAGGFNITGIVIDVATAAPTTYPDLCVDLLDPSPALTGGDPLLLQTATVGAGGTISFTSIVTDSVVGLLMSAKDCTTPGTTVYTTATGIFYESFQYLGAGDTLADQVSFSIDNTLLGGLEASATAAGYTGDLSTDGFMFGFVFDSARAPLDGMTVACSSCAPAWYLDADSADGLFTTAAALNTATSAAAGAAWLIPAGPIGQYTATDPGGVYTFGTQLNGSNPGSATATAFIAN